MTDYPAHRKTRVLRQSKSSGRRLSGLIAVIIFVVLIFVIFGGFVKTLIPGKISVSGGWSGQSSLAIALNSDPPAVIIFAKEAGKVGVFSLPADLKYATGNAGETVKQVDSLFKGPGRKAEAVLSNLNGVNISRFVYLENPPKLGRDQVYELFKKFSSLKTPIVIALGKSTFSSDLSKIELLRLWWEVKGLTLSQIDFVDVDNFSEKIIGENNKKFAAIDRESVNHQMTKYFKGAALGNIEILNNSGEAEATALARDMLGAYGWNVVNVGSSANVVAVCSINDPQESRDVGLLAGIFGCNIIRRQNASTGNPVLVLGSDFAKRYF